MTLLLCLTVILESSRWLRPHNLNNPGRTSIKNATRFESGPPGRMNKGFYFKAVLKYGFIKES